MMMCNGCKQSYQDNNGALVFNHMDKSDIADGLDKIKFVFKKYPKLYDILTKVVGPVYFDIQINKFIRTYIKDRDIIAVNFGSGTNDLSSDISNADIFAYKNVDLVCDISNIPIRDNTVDVIINLGVLEHVPDPGMIVEEFNRVLKPGGKIYCYFPFIVGFHASPHDYSRRTLEGMKELFRDFEIDSLSIAGGPTSAMLWIIQEWVSMVLSFGSPKLQRILYILLMLVTFPVKFLDILFKYYPTAKNISSGFSLVATKKEL